MSQTFARSIKNLKWIRSTRQRARGSKRTRRREPVNRGEDVETIMRKQQQKERKRNLAQWWRNKQLRGEEGKRGQQIDIWIVITCVCRSGTAECTFTLASILFILSIYIVYSTWGKCVCCILSCKCANFACFYLWCWGWNRCFFRHQRGETNKVTS